MNGEIIEVSEKVLRDQNINHLVLLIISSIALIFLFDKLKIPAALLSGTLLASGFLQIAEIATYNFLQI